MANLEFCDKHNMVAYLKKPSGSEGFQEIVDFLNVNNEEQEITAIVDGKEFTITEASVRRHLQLADVDGISVLPTTEIFDQLSLIGTQSTAIPKVPLPQGIGGGGSPRCQEAIGGSIAQARSERVPTLRSDEGSMTLQELTVLCTTLSKKVESLEADMKQTKQVYGAAYTKLIMKGEDQPEDQLGVLSAVKFLTDATKINVHTYTKRRREISTSSGGISTAGASMPVSTGSAGIITTGASIPVSTAGMVQEVNISIPSPIIVKDKGKGKMEESKDEQTKRTKL
ncbi:hypothetical protein Tco_0746521 [Tanacetum coccineum]